MGKRTRKGQKTRSPKRTSGLNQELTVVAVLDTMDEAKENEALLKNNDIPAMVKPQQDEFSDSKRYAVLVPEDWADEAHVIIESQDAYDDFYDLSMDDEGEEEDDLEGDIFEEGS
jgi:hypothetical protein